MDWEVKTAMENVPNISCHHTLSPDRMAQDQIVHHYAMVLLDSHIASGLSQEKVQHCIASLRQLGHGRGASGEVVLQGSNPLGFFPVQ